MRVLSARNVHQALVHGVEILQLYGQERQSRNGPVVVAPWPVTTVYQQPTERLAFWPQRDVNTAFLVYEALWMLAGRQDVAPLTRYIKDFGRFSDDGLTLPGAYGYRWRYAFVRDQLPVLVRRLRDDPDDRRCVLQIWDAQRDLDRNSRDIPCNDTVAFGRAADGRLEMTVFCRSNDILWGAYFANAYHFGLLQEYLARCIGCEVGIYRQVSVNYHAYVEPFKAVAELPAVTRGIYSVPTPIPDPYVAGAVHTIPVPAPSQASLDVTIRALQDEADEEYVSGSEGPDPDDEPWAYAQMLVLRAHQEWRLHSAPDQFTRALAVLDEPAFADVDIVASMRQWVERRQTRWQHAHDDGVNAVEAV